MMSTAKDGGTVTSYSKRFTISGMTGTADPKIKKAVQALAGSTAGPPDSNDVAAAVEPAAAPSVAADAAAFGVPYNKQNGATKYAPMQGIPPKKISLKKFTPMYPTSDYTVAQTWMPKPTVLTTLTASQTFHVESSINRVSILVGRLSRVLLWGMREC